jgi:hypothetical protein
MLSSRLDPGLEAKVRRAFQTEERVLHPTIQGVGMVLCPATPLKCKMHL